LHQVGCLTWNEALSRNPKKKRRSCEPWGIPTVTKTPDNNQLLKPAEAARFLAVSQSFTYKLADQGRIPCVKIPMECENGKQKHMLRFKYCDLLAFTDRYYQPLDA